MANKNDNVCGFLPGIKPDSPQGTIGYLKLSELRPTQNAVGMDEVDAKVKRIESIKDSDQLANYLLPRAVPVIIGNDAQYYLIDHHHLTISLWRAKGDVDVPVVVTRNWSGIKGNRFWKEMATNNWVPLRCHGRGAVQSGHPEKACKRPRQRPLPQSLVGRT